MAQHVRRLQRSEHASFTSNVDPEWWRQPVQPYRDVILVDLKRRGVKQTRAFYCDSRLELEAQEDIIRAQIAADIEVRVIPRQGQAPLDFMISRHELGILDVRGTQRTPIGVLWVPRDSAAGRLLLPTLEQVEQQALSLQAVYPGLF
jgi:hypothetical protein